MGFVGSSVFSDTGAGLQGGLLPIRWPSTVAFALFHSWLGIALRKPHAALDINKVTNSDSGAVELHPPRQVFKEVRRKFLSIVLAALVLPCPLTFGR